MGVTLRRHRIVLYTTAAALVGLIYFTLDWGALPQASVTARALNLRNDLNNDPRFANVQITAITTGDPHVLVRGTVRSESDLADLHRKVVERTPAVSVEIDVSVAKSP